jgi:hypothetical protein
MSPFKSKFPIIRTPSESKLLRPTANLTVACIKKLWDDLAMMITEFSDSDIHYFTFASSLSRVHTVIGMLSVCCEDLYTPLDDIAILLNSAMPKKLRTFLCSELDNFIESLVYLHREGARIEEYKRYFSWIDRLCPKVAIEKTSVTQPFRDYLGPIFASSRELEEKFTDKTTVDQMITRDDEDFESGLLFDGSIFLWYQGRFQSFILATRPISYETIVSLIEGIRAARIVFKEFIVAKNGVKKFAAAFFRGFLDRKEHYLIDLLKMIRNVAYVMADTPEYVEDPLLQTFTIARWFTPWIGIDLLDSSTVMKRQPNFQKGEEFLNWFEKSYLATMQAWDLEHRKLPVTKQEIKAFQETISSQFEITEVDSVIVDIVFNKNSKKRLEPAKVQILLFCIDAKIAQIFKIKLPDILVPNEWVRERHDPKYFSGANPVDYPKWRQQAMAQLLAANKENSLSLVLSLLKNPIASEIELSLDISVKKSKKKSPKVACCQLMDIFKYLDEAYKFIPDQDWVKSILFQNIETAIHGITDAAAKQKATLASTWKCDSFDEYMNIVSLF